MADPWANDPPLDTTYGGVEQAMPTKADFQLAAKEKPPTAKVIAMNGGDTRTALQILQDYQGPQDDPAALSVSAAGPPVKKDAAPWANDVPVQGQQDGAPWANDTPAPAWHNDVPAPTDQQQPWFGTDKDWWQDPTADVINKAKSIGEGFVDHPVEAMAGIGGSLAGMYGMTKEAINQLIPFTHMAGGTPVDPVSMMKDITQAGTNASQQLSEGADITGSGYQAGSDLVGSPWAMTGGAVGERLERAGFPQASAAVNLAGVYSILLGPKVASDIKANKFGSVDQLVDAGNRNAKMREVLDAYAQSRTAAMGNVLDGIIGATDDRYTTSRGLTPADEQKAMLDEHPAPGPQVEGMDVTDSSVVPHNLKEHLDIIADNPDAQPHQRALAQTYRNLNDVLGLDQVAVYGHEGKDPSTYERGTDSISINKDHPDLNHQILHEADHAINSAAIDLYDKVKDNPTEMEKLTPPQQDLMGRVADLHEVFKEANEEWNRQNPGIPKVKDDGTYSKELHGFQNLHEFVTDVKSRPEFQRTLRNLVGSKETMDRLANKRGGAPIRNMFQAAYRAIKDLFIPGESTMGERNYFSTAYDHVAGLTENMTPEMRTKGRTFEDKGNQLKEKFDAAQVENSKRLRGAEVFQDAHSMRNLLRQAATFNEFRDRLSIQHTDPYWKEFVEKNAERWWDPANRNKIIRVIGEDMDYRKLNRTDRQTAMDPRSVDEFIPQLKEDYDMDRLTPADERGLFGDEGMVVMPATILKNMKNKNLAGLVQAFWIDKTREYEIMGEQFLHEVKAWMNPFDKLKQKDKDAKMAISSYYDNSLAGRNELMLAGLQWPTREMLEAKGHAPHVIDAYLSETKMVDKMFDLMNESLAKRGYEPIKQIPGFMPHVHEGPFKVFVEFTDPAGQKMTSQVKGFHTRAGAKNFAQDLEDGKWDRPGNAATFRPAPDPVTGLPWRVNKPEIIEDSLIENLQDHLKAHANFANMDPSIRAYMEQMEARTLQGTLKSSLERSDVSGYLGEHGPVEGFLADRGLSPTNLRLSKLYDHFAKAVIEDYKNAMFQKEVYEPMLNSQHMGDLEHGSYYGPFTEALRTTTKYMREMGANFMNQNVNHLKVFDQDANMMMVDQLGLSPNLINATADALRNYISINALRGNVMFYASNVIQPGMALPILFWLNEERRKAGATQIPHTLVSLGKVLKHRFEPAPHLVEGLQWARENHVTDPLLDLQMVAPTHGSVGDKFNTATGGKINQYIEGSGKETVFMLAYQHMLDSGLSVEDARTAAAQVIDLTMVNYSKRARALMFQNYGVLGKMISPFAQFAQSYLGMMAMFGKQMAQNPLSLRSYKVLGATMLFYWATAGISGMPGFNLYDGTAGFINEWFPEWRVPTLQGLLMKAHMPQWMQVAGLTDEQGKMSETLRLGPLNALTRHLPGTPGGVYVSAPFGAPNLTGGISSAALPILEAIAQLGRFVVKAAGSGMGLNDPVTSADAYKAGMSIVPQPLRGAAQYAMQPKNTDVIGTTKSLEGEYRMKDADWFSLLMYGRPSLDYKNNADIERSVSVLDKQDTIAKKGLVQIGVNAELRGGNAADVADALASAMKRGYYEHAEDYYKDVAKAKLQQLTTAKERDAADEGKAAKNRMNERYRMEQFSGQ